MSSGRIHEIEGAQAKAIDIDLSSENHGLNVSCVSTLQKLLQNETHEVEFLQMMASAYKIRSKALEIHACCHDYHLSIVYQALAPPQQNHTLL